MNRTVLRHQMLTGVSIGRVASFHWTWDWADQQKRMWRRDARSLGDLERGDFIAIGTERDSAWRSVRLTDEGKVLLAEWDEKYGPVTP